MSIDIDFQRRYATTVLELEQLNKDLNKVLHEVQQYCCEVSNSRPVLVCLKDQLPVKELSKAVAKSLVWYLTLCCVEPACPRSGNGSGRSPYRAAQALWGRGSADGPDERHLKRWTAGRDKLPPHASHLPSHSSAAADQGTNVQRLCFHSWVERSLW